MLGSLTIKGFAANLVNKVIPELLGRSHDSQARSKLDLAVVALATNLEKSSISLMK